MPPPTPPELNMEETREMPIGMVPRPRKPIVRKNVLVASGRLLSLDAFRGLTVAGMLLVNNAALGDNTPGQLLHADWSGRVTGADLIFPWFLLIVGVAIPFSAASKKARWTSVFTRAAVLFGLGLLIESSLAHQPIFALNVLQLIAMAFLCGRLLYALPKRLRIGAALLLLLGYGIALRVGGPITENGNLVHRINETYLRFRWGSLAGLPSVIPTTALVLFGTLAGDTLRRTDLTPRACLTRLLIGGVALVAAGGATSLVLPMNKPIWTPSYICFAAGLGVLALAALHALVDRFGGRIARAAVFPLVVFGVNPLVAYVGAILFKIHVLQEWTIHGPNGKPIDLQDALLHACIDRVGRTNGGWLYMALYVGFWWLICALLYRRKIFVRA